MKPENMVGKTITHCHLVDFGQRLLMAFTDGTFVQMSIDPGYSLGEARLELSADERDIDDEDKAAIGLANAEHS